MKILHILPSLSGLCGGPVQVVIQLCEELKNHDIDTSIVTTKINEEKCQLMPNSVPVCSFTRQFSSFLPSEFCFSWGLERWLKEHIKEFDLIHIHYLFTYPSTLACSYAHNYRIPYIIRPAGMLSDFSLRRSALKKRLYILFFEKRNLKNAAAIHFTSQEEINEARRLRLNNKCIFVPPGLNLEIFKNHNSLKGLFRRQYPQIGNKKIILFLSRLDVKKGLDLLIPGLKTLSKKRNDFVFVVTGSGNEDYERWVKNTLVKLNLRELTIFTGFLEGRMKSMVMADADVFILPSYYENFGMAVIEAMASGIPVIISKRVGIHNFIENYQSGVVTDLDSQEIASALDRLLSDEQLRKEMGANGRRLVQENFDVKKTALLMLQAYSQMVKR